MLTREQILAAQDKPTISANVKEWGGEVFIKTMTGSERDRWESEWIEWRKTNGSSCFQAFLLVNVVVDSAGNPLFTKDDVKTLNDKSSKVISALYRKAAMANGIGSESDENAEKN